MDDETIKHFAYAGLTKIFNSPERYYDKVVKEPVGLEILNDSAFEPYFEHLFELGDSSGHWIEKISGTFLLELNKGAGIPPSEFWRQKFLTYSTPEYISERGKSYLRGATPWVDLGLALNESPKTFEIFVVLHSRVLEENWINERYRSMLDAMIKESPLSLKLFVESNLFKKGKFDKAKPAVRGLLYSRYITQGFLTQKTARKIRSDSSFEASKAGLVALLNSKDTYSGYEDLLLCFTDSRHEAVVNELSRRLPLNLISSLLGTDFVHAKSIIERRMTNGV
tara:strand:+ start:17669 stop:18511 length:843 start_codon:yes stop_codon:yes gene_type:complete